MRHEEPDREIVAALARSRATVVLTGSGISAESGIATFRDPQSGLWARFRAEDLATPEAFARDPALVWRWYEWRRGTVRAATPNAGHLALVALAARLPRFTLVTQNVDGLHQRAGSVGVIELHGSVLRSRCTREGRLVEPVEGEACSGPPPCPACGAPLRPDVVWFGEALPEAALAAATDAVCACDAFLAVGTSALVHPAAGFAALARRAGATVIEINPEATPASGLAHHVVRASAGTALPALAWALGAT